MTSQNESKTTIEFTGQEMAVLRMMVNRGWSGGDLADYLNADQILACHRVLKRLGLNPQDRQPHPKARTQGQ